MTAPQYLWSDAWLLLAIGYAARSRSGSLVDVIEMADGIQHAIPTLDEVNGAIGRLGRGGYLAPAAGGARFALTEAGEALLAAAESKHRIVLDVQDEVERLLGAPAWSAGHEPAKAPAGEPVVVTESELAAAYDEYMRR